MRIRDAEEADAPVLATLADAPVEVMRNIVHDRTVRVAERAQGASTGTDDGAGSSTGENGESARGEGGATGDEGSVSGEERGATDEEGSVTGQDEVATAEDGGATATDRSPVDEERAGDPTGREVVGYVSFDAERETVFVTQLNGEREAIERLLEEPIRFARRESMAVELLATSSDDRLRSVADAAGFEFVGDGPTFKNGPTKRYRIESH